MNITLTGKKISQDERILAFKKDNLTAQMTFTVDTDDSWVYKLDVRLPVKCCTGEELFNIIDLPMDANRTCTIDVTAAMVPFTGKYTMQLRGISGEQVYHSDTFEVWVKYSIDPGAAYDPVPSEFYQIEDNITEINNHPPYPDISGFWMIWNPTTHQYELSTIPVPTEGGGDKTYIHKQVIASNTWEITHNLYKYPSVSVVDTGGNVVVGDVEYTSLNTLVIKFTAPFSGTAYLN